MGAIVPMTFLADKSAAGIRKSLLHKDSLNELIIYPEKSKIFENVTQACSIFVVNFAKVHSEIIVSKMKSISELDSQIVIPTSIIKLTSPLLCPIPLVDRKEISLLEKLSSFPKLGEIEGISNKRGELDLTIDKQFLNGQDKCLLKGISIDQYRTKEIFNVNFKSFVKAKEHSSRTNDIYLMRIAGQQISNLGSNNRLKFSLVLPEFILGNSLNYLTVDKTCFNNSFNIYTLLGLMNSKILNWRFKLTSSNNHVNNYEIDDLPIPIDAPKKKVEQLNKLVESLISSNSKNQIDEALLEKINLAVLTCYNISTDDWFIN
jgi:Alw26I/Eco31I/Esp3I family type II restriction m6 adenine DNA methyltransferase